MHLELYAGLAESLDPASEQGGGFHFDGVDASGGGDEGFNAELRGPVPEGV